MLPFLLPSAVPTQSANDTRGARAASPQPPSKRHGRASESLARPHARDGAHRTHTRETENGQNTRDTRMSPHQAFKQQVSGVSSPTPRRTLPIPYLFNTYYIAPRRTKHAPIPTSIRMYLARTDMHTHKRYYVCTSRLRLV